MLLTCFLLKAGERWEPRCPGRRPGDIFSEEIRAHGAHHLCRVWPLLRAWLSPATESYDAYGRDGLQARWKGPSPDSLLY